MGICSSTEKNKNNNIKNDDKNSTKINENNLEKHNRNNKTNSI